MSGLCGWHEGIRVELQSDRDEAVARLAVLTEAAQAAVDDFYDDEPWIARSMSALRAVLAGGNDG